MMLSTIKIMYITLVAIVFNLIYLGPKYTGFKADNNVNLKSQDKFNFDFNFFFRYFAHNIHSTNINVLVARERKIYWRPCIIKVGGSNMFYIFLLTYSIDKDQRHLFLQHTQDPAIVSKYSYSKFVIYWNILDIPK